MSRLLIITMMVVIALAGFFAWANWYTRRKHARSSRRDVQRALERLVGSGCAGRLDDWHLFLAWPIDNPYLESVRQRCSSIYEEFAADDDELETRIKAILEELENHDDAVTSDAS